MSGTDHLTPAPRYFSICLPRPLWTGLAAVVLTIVAGGLWIGVPIYRQRVAIREIERAGGNVVYMESGQDWLFRWLGDDGMSGLAEVAGVSLSETEFIDADLESIRVLNRIRRLNLRSTRVTDAGCRHLEVLVSLQELNLDDTKVSDAGLPHLERLKRLEYLSLERTRLTDEGLGRLKGLPHLRELSLRETKATDAGVAELRRALPRLWIHHRKSPPFEADPRRRGPASGEWETDGVSVPGMPANSVPRGRNEPRRWQWLFQRLAILMRPTFTWACRPGYWADIVGPL